MMNFGGMSISRRSQIQLYLKSPALQIIEDFMNTHIAMNTHVAHTL